MLLKVNELHNSAESNEYKNADELVDVSKKINKITKELKYEWHKKFALVVLVINPIEQFDRYTLIVVTNISGLGYKIKVIHNWYWCWKLWNKNCSRKKKKQLSMTVIHKSGYSSANFLTHGAGT